MDSPSALLKMSRIMKALPSDEDRGAVLAEICRLFGRRSSDAVRSARYRVSQRAIPDTNGHGNQRDVDRDVGVTESVTEPVTAPQLAQYVASVVPVVPAVASASKKQQLRREATEVLEFLNLKTGRSFRVAEGNLSLIMARLASGASVQDCKGVIARQVREWKTDEKMSKFLRPETLFNRTKFESYLGQRERADG